MKNCAIVFLAISLILVMLAASGCSSKSSESSVSGLPSGSSHSSSVSEYTTYTTEIVNSLDFANAAYSENFVETDDGVSAARGQIPVEKLPAKIIIHSGDLVISLDSLVDTTDSATDMMIKGVISQNPDISDLSISPKLTDDDGRSLNQYAKTEILDNGKKFETRISVRHGYKPTKINLQVNYYLNIHANTNN